MKAPVCVLPILFDPCQVRDTIHVHLVDTVRRVVTDTLHIHVFDTLGVVLPSSPSWAVAYLPSIFAALGALAAGGAAIASWSAAAATSKSARAAEMQAVAASRQAELASEQIEQTDKVVRDARFKEADALRRLCKRIATVLGHLTVPGPSHKQLRVFSQLPPSDVDDLAKLARSLGGDALSCATIAVVPLREIIAFIDKAHRINEATGWIPDERESTRWRIALEHAARFLNDLQDECARIASE